MCLQLLSKSLDQVQGESWFGECGDGFIKHIPLFAGIPEEKVSAVHRETCIVVILRFQILWLSRH